MTLGKVGAPNAAVYTASKHAVEGLTKAAALEGAETGVRVNARGAWAGRDRDAQPIHGGRRG